jgi:hypothetical protein
MAIGRDTNSRAKKTMLRHAMGASAVGIALALLLASPAWGQEAHDDHHDDDHFHANHVAVVVGGMTPLSETSQTSFALGADYERRLNPLWGIGIGADFTFGDHKRTALFAGGVSYRPTPELRLGTGPGFELVEKDQSGGGTKNKAYFIWGFSAFYEFHVGSLAIGPNVILDFVGETKTNLTYGIAVGTGF